jgi:hypothetical protein
MAKDGRLVAAILEVSNLGRSEALYRDGFGLNLHLGDNGVDDRWIGGRHAEISWHEGAYLHFAPYPAKEKPTSGAQIALSVVDIEIAHSAAVSAGAHQPRTLGS